MLKLIYTIILWLKSSPIIRDAETDPLSHPTIRAMNPDELADIPFASTRRPTTC